MKRRIVFRKKKQNQFGIFLVMIVVFMLLLVVTISRDDLELTKEKYDTKVSELEKEIEQEEKRAADLVEFRKYTKTKKYVEEVARDKLGLINPDGIIFKSKE